MTNANAGHCESSFLKHPFLKRALSAASELALRITSCVLGNRAIFLPSATTSTSYSSAEEKSRFRLFCKGPSRSITRIDFIAAVAVRIFSVQGFCQGLPSLDNCEH